MAKDKKLHKKPPIRNRSAVVPVKVVDLHKAAEKAVERAIWLTEEALREEFGFGDARIQRLRAKVDEMAQHKTWEAWVDQNAMNKLRA